MENRSATSPSGGIPADTPLVTKPQMGLEVIKRATENKVPYTWVSGDSLYGDARYISRWLQENNKYYVLAVSGKAGYYQQKCYRRVKDILETLPTKKG